MKEKLTDEDKSLLRNLNLLRFDKYFYGGLLIAAAVLMTVLFFIPYTGWKVMPKTEPKDLQEYLSRLLPYLIIWLLMILLPLINWIVKRLEEGEGIKTIKRGTVKAKRNLILKRKLIVFDPFLPIVYRRSYHFMDLKPSDKVEMELTAFGRLLKYKKLD
jgi:branched-subunit amino acid transport protein AzlD